jgi:hypothetical protein
LSTTVVAVAILEPATATTALLPGGVGGNGRAVLNAANLHASAGQGSVEKPSLTILTQAKRQHGEKQGFGSGFNQISGSGSVFGIRIQEGKKDPQKLRNFMF